MSIKKSLIQSIEEAQTIDELRDIKDTEVLEYENKLKQLDEMERESAKLDAEIRHLKDELSSCFYYNIKSVLASRLYELTFDEVKK